MHVHKYIPLLTKSKDRVAWEAQMTLPPRYPWVCDCGKVSHFTHETAESDGQIKIFRLDF